MQSQILNKKKIVTLPTGEIKIYLNSPAKEGKANQELTRTLSKLLKIPIARIQITSGQTSKTKTVDLDTNLKITQILEILSEAKKV